MKMKLMTKTENDNDIATYEITPQVDQPVKQETDESKISVKEKSQTKRKNQINMILSLCFLICYIGGSRILFAKFRSTTVKFNA